MQAPSPFHVGEQRVQERMGVREVEQWARHAIRGYLPPQHRAFHTSVPFLVAAARDGDDRPWATLLVGEPGFVTSPEPTSLVIDAAPPAGDALEGALTTGRDLGILGIELSTRRRNRVNVRIDGARGRAVVAKVQQTFGNCPQHIHERAWRRVAGEPAGAAVRSERLTPHQRAWIERADTFFIASGHRGDGESSAFGMDASHRGGDPGFVRVEADDRIAFPDFAGNNLFNTLGNLELDPRAGVLFVDFPTGSLLQLTGRMRVDWSPSAADRARGAARMMTFDVEAIVELPRAVPLRWHVEPDALALRVTAKMRESEDVVSFILESADEAALPSFTAGQHLPIAVTRDGGASGLDERTYSLSGPPGADFYRISVKREPRGVVSRRLHDGVEVGDVIRAHAPRGDFVLDAGHDGATSPVVLVSAGVGVTPLVAMLHALTAAGAARPVWFVHGARDGAHRPFAREVAALAKRRGNVVVHTALSAPLQGDSDDDAVGRIDEATFARLAPPLDADYYLCGPAAFMASIQTLLERRGVSADRIHSETFGPSGSR